MSEVGEKTLEFAILAAEIAEMKESVEPIVRSTGRAPMFAIVKDVLDLPKNLDGENIADLRVRVERLKTRMREAKIYEVAEMISGMPTSKAFKVLQGLKRFQSGVAGKLGERVTVSTKDPLSRKIVASWVGKKESELGEETEVKITKKMLSAMAHKRSLGVPVSSAKTIRHLEQAIFGSTLRRTYDTRELIGMDNQDFRDLIDLLGQTVDQSIDYTSEVEMSDFTEGNLVAMEDGRHLFSSVVSGDANTVKHLVQRYLLAEKEDAENHVVALDEQEKLDQELLDRISRGNGEIYIVPVKSLVIPKDKKAEWERNLAKVIFVDASENAKKMNLTVAFSYVRKLKDGLDRAHLRELGRPSNVEMNFRRILERFDLGQLTRMRDAVKTRSESTKAEYEAMLESDPSECRKREWCNDLLMQHFTAARMQDVLTMIIDFVEKGAVPDAGKLEGLVMKNYFSGLKEGYSCDVVPSGGGRRALRALFKVHRDRTKAEQIGYRSSKLSTDKLKLQEMEQGYADKIGVPYDSRYSAAGNDALRRAVDAGSSDNASIMGDLGDVDSWMKALLVDLKRATREKGAAIRTVRIGWAMQRARAAGMPITGGAYLAVVEVLKAQGMAEVAKFLTKGAPAGVADHIRSFTGRLAAAGAESAISKEVVLRAGEEEIGSPQLRFQFIGNLLAKIESGTLDPTAMRGDSAWSYADVLDGSNKRGREYNVETVRIKPDGGLDLTDFRTQLTEKKAWLRDFPELEKVYFSSLVLVVNDPNNPTGHVMSAQEKLELLDLAHHFGLTIVDDAAYFAQVDSETKDLQGYKTLAEFAAKQPTRFGKQPGFKILTALPTTKLSEAGGRRTAFLVVPDEYIAEVRSAVNEGGSVNPMSIFMERASLESTQKAKEISSELREAMKIGLGGPREKAITILDKLIAGREQNPPQLHMKLIEARNMMDRLYVRSASPKDYEVYLDQVISEIKDWRFEKLTQREVNKRRKVVQAAMAELRTERPDLVARCTTPDGPPYFAFRVSQASNPVGFDEFIKAMASRRGLDLVPQEPRGTVRYAFGGYMGSGEMDKEFLGRDVKDTLLLLDQYWERFRLEEAKIREAGDAEVDSIAEAVKAIFGAQSEDYKAVFAERGETLLVGSQLAGMSRNDVLPYPNSISDIITKIDPESGSETITLEIDDSISTKEDLVKNNQFRRLFDWMLLQVQDEIPELRGMRNDMLLARWGIGSVERYMGATERLQDGSFEKRVVSQITDKIMRRLFSPKTILILKTKHKDDGHGSQKSRITGAAERTQLAFMNFLTSLGCENVNEFEGGKLFQTGYAYMDLEESLGEITADKKAAMSFWKQAMLGMPIVTQAVEIDPTPDTDTGSTARPSDKPHTILRRDGDGKAKPTAEFFESRAVEFIRNMDRSKYMAKVIQIGPLQTLMIMDRSYSGYIAEELRLFPQFELSPEEILAFEPDSVSLLGIPTDVMGDSYRVGYAGGTTPLSWVDREQMTDYMGNYKKPLLTAANEKIEQMGGKSIHGSAVSIDFKSGFSINLAFGGDSGAGKSETIVAMVEKAISQHGGVDEVEGIHLLAGDMLSIWKDEKGAMRIFGTESGDFMRMSDISSTWQATFKDLLDRATSTNSSSSNPRKTVPDIADPKRFLMGPELDGLYFVNNIEAPKDGRAVALVSDTRTFAEEYYKSGARGEKGTSGDQPNLFLTLMADESPAARALARKYNYALDRVLGWLGMQNERGKTYNGKLKFNDVRNERMLAEAMVREMFQGKVIDHGGEKMEIVGVVLDITKKDAVFSVELEPVAGRETLADRAKGRVDNVVARARHARGRAGHIVDLVRGRKTEEAIPEPPKRKVIPLDRKLFDSVYSRKIASTFFGHPFIDPVTAAAMYEPLSNAMQAKGVEVGVMYSRLAEKGQTISGPSAVADAIMDDAKFNKNAERRFNRLKIEARNALKDIYGDWIAPNDNIAVSVLGHNIASYARREAAGVKIVRLDNDKVEVPIRIKDHFGDPEAVKGIPALSLIDENRKKQIDANIRASQINPANMASLHFEASNYSKIIHAESIEELVFQVMLIDNPGGVTFDMSEEELATYPKRAGEAYHRAKLLIESSGQFSNLRAELATREAEMRR